MAVSESAVRRADGSLESVPASDDLTASLFGLASLLSAHVPLDDTLLRIANYTQAVVRGAEGAAVTLLDKGRPAALVASQPLIKDAEALQYDLGQGPSITAVEQREVVRSPSVGGDGRWPRFGAHVARLGLHSVLVAPLILPDTVIGTLSVYAPGKMAFDDESAVIAETYSVPAAAVTNSKRLLAQSEKQIKRLTEALTNRSVIDQAIGILRSRSGISGEEAFARLRQISNTEHIKVIDVARQVVDNSVRRARRRQGSD